MPVRQALRSMDRIRRVWFHADIDSCSASAAPGIDELCCGMPVRPRCADRAGSCIGQPPGARSCVAARRGASPSSAAPNSITPLPPLTTIHLQLQVIWLLSCRFAFREPEAVFPGCRFGLEDLVWDEAFEARSSVTYRMYNASSAEARSR